MHLHSPASFFSSLGTQNLSKKNLKTNSSPCLRLKHQSEFYSNFYSNQGRLKSLLILETYSVPVKFTTMALIKFLLEFMLRFWLVHWVIHIKWSVCSNFCSNLSQSIGIYYESLLIGESLWREPNKFTFEQ